MVDPAAPQHGNGSSSSAGAWDSAHWAQLQSLYHLAAAAPPGERTRILHEASNDSELVQRVLDLLGADEALNEEGTPPEPPLPLRERVGPWLLLHLLGTGGLGAVYLAESVRGGAVQQGALKVLGMNASGPAMQARFLREQQTLARLQHPHIPRMLDAGFTETGKPYLVMEYVDGQAITAHCDAADATISTRVRAFLQVCDAVSYAHRMLIVHLDLKPQNIFVSTTGAAQLLDFGTSKLVEADLSLTTTVLATPAYASPEQMRNEPVTTACDIYGLGAVLYELLSGVRPWGTASPAMVLEHALRQDEPPLLAAAVSDSLDAAKTRSLPDAAALRSALRGDLSSIVARCLRHRPADRYPTADALREDLQRYLDGLPVRARPQTLGYRLTKFLRRRRLQVSIAAAALLVIVASLVYGAVRQHQALVAANRAVQMQNFLYSLLRLANSNYAGHPTTTIADFLQLGVRALPEFIHDPADRRAAELSLGESMFDSSDYEHAVPVLLAVRDQSRRVHDAPSEMESAAFAGMAQSEQGHAEDATALLDQAMALRGARGVTAAQRLWVIDFYVSNRFNTGGRDPADAAMLADSIAEAKRAGAPDRELGWALGNLATLYSRENRPDDAQRVALESLTVLQRQPYTACDQAFTIALLGDVAFFKGDDAAALQRYQDGYKRVLACKGTDDLATLELVIQQGRVLVHSHRSGEAILLLGPTVPVWRKVLPGNPEIGYTLTLLGQAYLQQSKPADATRMAREALAAETGKLKPNSLALAITWSVLAKGLDGEGHLQDALAAAQRADQIFDGLPPISALNRQIALDNKAELAHLVSMQQ